jgi:hypothetical protein
MLQKQQRRKQNRDEKIILYLTGPWFSNLLMSILTRPRKNDASIALATLKKLHPACSSEGADVEETDEVEVEGEMTTVEEQLMEHVTELQEWNWIFGTSPTLEEIVNPVEEKEIDNDNADVINQVRKSENEERVLEDIESDNNEEAMTKVPILEITSFCAKLPTFSNIIKSCSICRTVELLWVSY